VPQTIKTDNKSVANKVFLRRKATEHLEDIRVLDLFAGNNVLWRCIETERYYGVELTPEKGRNLNADAKQALISLDLSQFNVIDCDSYGIPFEICSNLLKNPALKSGTVVLYTAITNIFAQMPNVVIDALNIRELYDIVPSVFNAQAITCFYDMLANHGVQEISFYELIDQYTKHYGYFIVA